jgi:hypothetical protein
MKRFGRAIIHAEPAPMHNPGRRAWLVLRFHA